MAWLVTITPLGLLILAGALLGRGLARGRGARGPAIPLAIGIMSSVVVLGPYVTGAGGIFGGVAELISFVSVLVGSWLAALIVAVFAETGQRLPLAIAFGLPLLFWMGTVLRDTVPQDRATACAVEAMGSAIEQVRRERGEYPQTVQDLAVAAAYQRTFELYKQNGCLNDPIPSWIQPFVTTNYTVQLNTNGWRYSLTDTGYSLAFFYQPLKLDWLGERACRYNPSSHQASCAIAWW